MAITAIKFVLNKTNRWMFFLDHENYSKWLVMAPYSVVTSPYYAYQTDAWIPWCTSMSDYRNGKFIEIGTWNDADGMPLRSFVIWQQDRWNEDHDRVRFAGSSWDDRGNNWMAGGESVDGDRWLQINSYTYPDPPPPPGDTSLVLTRSRPFAELAADTDSSGSTMTPAHFLKGTEAPSGDDRLVAFPATKASIPPDYSLPNTGTGTVRLAWWPIPNGPNMWVLDIYPDGQGIYPGLPSNNVMVLSRKAMDAPKICEVWREASPNSWQIIERDVLLGKAYGDPMRWMTVDAQSTLVFSASGSSIGIDPADFFRVFGGKRIVWDWTRG